jgi:hypothetical protein
MRQHSPGPSLRPATAATAVSASANGGGLLAGGLALLALALASGSLLRLVNRAGEWETRT